MMREKKRGCAGDVATQLAAQYFLLVLSSSIKRGGSFRLNLPAFANKEDSQKKKGKVVLAR